ncbi:MAG: hypothetical protein M3R30_05385 [Candidatus Eremiobacteraeota bacterium]|nr:hypothetical protein [Candidatus Eremiobacteraeota bacterium]
MFTDARIGDALDTMVRGLVVPPVPLAAIHRKISQPRPAAPRLPSYVRLALAAAALIAIAIVAFPSTSAALIQSVEARYRAALQALGGTAPPPAPQALISSLHVRSATLASARSRVRFTIVPPAGLPQDVVSIQIDTAPTGVYSKATRSWSVGSPSVTFSYRRSGGRAFSLRADRYDPQATLTGKYMFEALDPGPDGRPRLLRHRQFAWRNGNQIMTVIEDAGIGSREIEAIRQAMHGVILPQRDLHAPDRGASGKLYIAP